MQCKLAGAVRSYDGIAEVYDRLAVARTFARPNRDLAALLDAPAGALVLDVGTGAGAGAAAISEHSGPDVMAVGLDASLSMLRWARQRGIERLVAATVRGLPFGEAVFDRVFACFVLSHVGAHQKALADMVRVLKPGGRLGIAAWGSGGSGPRKLWQAIARGFADAEVLERGFREALPNEEFFADPRNLRSALRNAGLVSVRVVPRRYRMKIPLTEYLELREISVQARLIRELLSPAKHKRFQRELRREFQLCFGAQVVETRDALLAVGNQP